MESLGFSRYSIMSSENGWQFYFFPSNLNAFYFFFLSDCCDWTSNTIVHWIKVIRVGILVLFLILEVKRSVFTAEYDVNCWLVIYGLYYIEVCSLYTHFVESSFFLNHKWMLNFVKCLFCIYWDDWPCDFYPSFC